MSGDWVAALARLSATAVCLGAVLSDEPSTLLTGIHVPLVRRAEG